MIALLARLALGLGISERFSRLAAWAAAFVGAVLLAWAGWSLLTGWIIDKHETGQALEQSQADRTADNNRAVERLDDTIRLGNEASELKGAQEHAETDMDRRLARQRCIRMQQAARADGRLSPACGRF